MIRDVTGVSIKAPTCLVGNLQHFDPLFCVFIVLLMEVFITFDLFGRGKSILGNKLFPASIVVTRTAFDGLFTLVCCFKATG